MGSAASKHQRWTGKDISDQQWSRKSTAWEEGHQLLID